MTSEAARRAIDSVLKHEGGYVWHKSDPGGETNFGISKRAYPNEDIRNLTRDRAAELYHCDYWMKICGDELPAPVAFVVMDAAVNSGVKRAGQWLQQALEIPSDGIIGRQTIAAASADDPVVLAETICDIRLEFLRRLPTWPTFGRGWQRRVDSVRAEAGLL